MRDDDHDDFGGLSRDLQMMSRRRMFGWMAGIALTPVIGGCVSDSELGPDAATTTGTDGTTGTGSCSRIPTETAGPYPGDGTNGPNALTLSGFNRSDIRTSVGTASGTADGAEFKVTLTIVNASTCEPLVGYAVYIWHATRDGAYSMYQGTAQSENYLRGVQVTDANGQVTFTTIFPGCYSGRWPHIHFEIYSSLAAATNGSAKVAVSQLALPKATCDAVYTTTGYSASVSNLAQTSLASDMVFSDGSSLQLPTISGSVGPNLSAALTVAVG